MLPNSCAVKMDILTYFIIKYYASNKILCLSHLKSTQGIFVPILTRETYKNSIYWNWVLDHKRNWKIHWSFRGSLMRSGMSNILSQITSLMTSNETWGTNSSCGFSFPCLFFLYFFHFISSSVILPLFLKQRNLWQQAKFMYHKCPCNRFSDI